MFYVFCQNIPTDKDISNENILNGLFLLGIFPFNRFWMPPISVPFFSTSIDVSLCLSMYVVVYVWRPRNRRWCKVFFNHWTKLYPSLPDLLYVTQHWIWVSVSGTMERFFTWITFVRQSFRVDCNFFGMASWLLKLVATSFVYRCIVAVAVYGSPKGRKEEFLVK